MYEVHLKRAIEQFGSIEIPGADDGEMCVVLLRRNNQTYAQIQK